MLAAMSLFFREAEIAGCWAVNLSLAMYIVFKIT